MSKKVIMSIGGLLFVVLSLMCFIKFSSAEIEGGARFDNVVPFATPNGNFCFFNQKTGIVYVYDTSLKQCITKVKMGRLGAAAVAF